MICQRFWLFHDFENQENTGSLPASPMLVAEGFESTVMTPQQTSTPLVDEGLMESTDGVEVLIGP